MELQKFHFFFKKLVGTCMTYINVYNLTQIHHCRFTNPYLHEMNGCHASGMYRLCSVQCLPVNFIVNGPFEYHNVTDSYFKMKQALHAYVKPIV